MPWRIQNETLDLFKLFYNPYIKDKVDKIKNPNNSLKCTLKQDNYKSRFRLCNVGIFEVFGFWIPPNLIYPLYLASFYYLSCERETMNEVFLVFDASYILLIE